MRTRRARYLATMCDWVVESREGYLERSRDISLRVWASRWEGKWECEGASRSREEREEVEESPDFPRCFLRVAMLDASEASNIGDPRGELWLLEAESEAVISSVSASRL